MKKTITKIWNVVAGALLLFGFLFMWFVSHHAMPRRAPGSAQTDPVRDRAQFVADSLIYVKNKRGICMGISSPRMNDGIAVVVPCEKVGL
jgi:hypothetical protein